MNSNKRIIYIFILLIILILGILIYYNYSNKKDNNIDRKIDYIISDITYDYAFNKGQELFLNAIKLIKNDFEFEKKFDNIEQYYVIDNTECKRITNIDLIFNTLSSNSINDYLVSHNILIEDKKYYLKDYENNISNQYVGSLLTIDSNDNNNIYFKSTNYFCENSKYLGVLDNEPKCGFTKSEVNFIVILENNTLKIKDIDKIENSLK